jgi:hypothetical protein
VRAEAIPRVIQLIGGMMEEIGEVEVEFVELVDEESLPEFALMVDLPD